MNETNTIESEWSIKNMEIEEGEFLDTGDGEFQVEKLIIAGREDWTEDDNQIDIKSLQEQAQKLLEDVSVLRDQVCIQSLNLL